MSKVVLRVAQVVGVLVLAGIAISVAVGLVQWLLGIALIVAIPVGAYWIYKQVKARRQPPALAAGAPVTLGPGSTASGVARATDRRAELEGRAVIDAAGRCGWCGSAALHKDEFGFPTTPLKYHRAEIDAML
ncbi:hypothetical protein LWC33_32990 [Pseudonocardia sp. RS11V-5]|uniref:hypothetical protein n=1 Tax=Pseudonocardia terrae TaxID=2905831 RepID=UPI001E456CAE|nr:hypothetical protein [Pseudonocardia terrae]MCE3556245.1 hypothetical protein [Pseudonocardia terrae]